MYLRTQLRELTSFYRYTLHAPPPRLCTDNGVMIAWAAMERLKMMEAGELGVEEWAGRTGVCWEAADHMMLDPSPNLPLGTDITLKVKAMKIKVKNLTRKRLTKLFLDGQASEATEVQSRKRKKQPPSE